MLLIGQTTLGLRTLPIAQGHLVLRSWLAAQRAAEQAKRESDEAKRKAEEEAERKRAEEALRVADLAHRGRINREARDAFIAEARLTEEQATACVKAISTNSIPHIKIIY